MEILGVLWDQVIMRPMINSISLLYLVFGSFGVSILVFTAIVKVLTIPLTIRQTRQMKRMSELQPKMKAIQERYKGKSDADSRRQQQQETMRLYREAGVNPVGCLGPMFIQFPIWIGLYQAILRVVPPTPEGLVRLSESFYSWNPAARLVPFNSHFLGMDMVDLVQAGPLYFAIAMPVLVGVSMFIQQKLTTPASTDPRQAQTNQIMLWTMPVMFGYFTLLFPAGLGIYILFSNILGIIIQYFIAPEQSKEALLSMTSLIRRRRPALQTAAAVVEVKAEDPSGEKLTDGGQTVHGENGRRGDRDRAENARRRTRRRRYNRR